MVLDQLSVFAELEHHSHVNPSNTTTPPSNVAPTSVHSFFTLESLEEVSILLQYQVKAALRCSEIRRRLLLLLQSLEPAYS